MKDNTTYKVLSIDGGGIKGLYSAVILKIFEEKFGGKISDYFHMICGTSTGGIIAAALSIGISASEIVDFYKNDGPKIFPPPKNNFSSKYSKAKQFMVGSKYGSSILRESLERVFKDKKMGDALVSLCIPSFNITNGSPTVFKVDHHSTLCRDNKHLLLDVLMATAAAPTYFPVHSIPTMTDDLYVDGGIWANNPALIGIIEAIKYYVHNQESSFTRYQVLSLGSIEKPFSINPKNVDLSFSKWVMSEEAWLLESIFQAQSSMVENVIKHLGTLLPGDYVRISSPNLTADRLKNIKLDNASKEALKDLESIGNEVGYQESMRKEVLNFFRKNGG